MAWYLVKRRNIFTFVNQFSHVEAKFLLAI